MKALIASATLIVITTLMSNAQVFKGNTFIGGTITSSFYSNVNPTNASKTTNTNFSIQPSFGYFISPKLAIGAGIGYSYSHYNFQYYLDPYNPNGVNRSNLYSISPFIRYFIPITKSFYFSLHGQISYGIGNAVIGNSSYLPNTTIFYEDGDVKWSSLSASIQPVFIFYPTTHWGIEAAFGSAGYNYSIYNPSNLNVAGNQTIKSFYANGGSMLLGLSYYFQKSKNKS